MVQSQYILHYMIRGWEREENLNFPFNGIIFCDGEGWRIIPPIGTKSSRPIEHKLTGTGRKLLLVHL